MRWGSTVLCCSKKIPIIFFSSPLLKFHLSFIHVPSVKYFVIWGTPTCLEFPVTFHGWGGDGHFSETTHFTIIHFYFFLVMHVPQITYLYKKQHFAVNKFNFTVSYNINRSSTTHITRLKNISWRYCPDVTPVESLTTKIKKKRMTEKWEFMFWTENNNCPCCNLLWKVHRTWALSFF